MPIEIQDPRRLPHDFSIFFCWQDHLPKKLYRFLIRDALDRAIAMIQDELPEGSDCVLRRDEATEGRAGSVEIANTILQKLNSSTVVIGDVTPVLVDSDKGWYYPNPNVMVEIGHASRAIGWNRVICLYNDVVCKAEQLPFDIRHRRVTAFSCGDESKRKQAGVELVGILVSAIRAVIQEIRRGEIDQSIGDAARRHQRDLRFLQEVMSTIHRRTLDRFIELGQAYQVHHHCVYFWHGFNAIVCSCDFRFYDKELKRLALDLHQVWGAAIYHGSYAFGPGTLPGSLVLKPEYLWNEAYEKTLRDMEAAYTRLPTVLNAFLDHVHLHFSEIDMDVTDQVAWERNLPYLDGTALQRLQASEAYGADKNQDSPTYLSQVEQDNVDPPTAERVKKMADLLGANSDEWNTLAGRLPEDLPGIIQKQPAYIPDLLREASGMSAEQLAELLKKARKLNEQNKPES